MAVKLVIRSGLRPYLKPATKPSRECIDFPQLGP